MGVCIAEIEEKQIGFANFDKMKTHFLFYWCLLMVSCATEPPPFVYPDYPKEIVDNHLEQEFDTVKWFVYSMYANARCVVWSDQDFYWDKDGNVRDPPVTLDRANRVQLLTCPIVIDSLSIQGDTALFFTTVSLNKEVYCTYVRYNDLKGKLNDIQYDIWSNVAVSIATDTIIYIKANTSKKYDSPDVMVIKGDPFNNPLGNSNRNRLLKERIVANKSMVNPWLLKQAQKRGWLKEEPQP